MNQAISGGEGRVPREENRGRFQDVFRLATVSVLLIQPHDVGQLLAAWTRTGAGVGLGLLHPLSSVSGPSLGDNAWAAAQAEPYSSSRSRAIRVARSRCSSDYLVSMIWILRKKGSGIEPGWFIARCSSRLGDSRASSHPSTPVGPTSVAKSPFGTAPRSPSLIVGRLGLVGDAESQSVLSGIGPSFVELFSWLCPAAPSVRAHSSRDRRALLVWLEVAWTNRGYTEAGDTVAVDLGQAAAIRVQAANLVAKDSIGIDMQFARCRRMRSAGLAGRSLSGSPLDALRHRRANALIRP